jgi:hypothetical protein
MLLSTIRAKRVVLMACVVIAAGFIGVRAPNRAEASGSACAVQNLNTGWVYTGEGFALQTAIDESLAGATLQVTGWCTGNFTIAKDVRLVGLPTIAAPTPTLDGNGLERVIKVESGVVSLVGLTVTNGAGSYNGGGILNRGVLTLRRVSVEGNMATFGGGGGIWNAAIATLEVQDSSVTGNTSPHGSGGGIGSRGKVVVRGTTSIIGNSAGEGVSGGGGIFNRGRLVLRGGSLVRDNLAPMYGGGILNAGALTLRGTSSVVRNVALADGGGVSNTGVPVATFYVCADWRGRISPNTPDDAPIPTVIAC